MPHVAFVEGEEHFVSLGMFELSLFDFWPVWKIARKHF